MTRGWPHHGRDGLTAVTVDLDRREVHVPTPDGGHVVVDPRARRRDVVGRLLELGVSPRTLHALLPDWAALITAVATQLGMVDPRMDDDAGAPELGA